MASRAAAPCDTTFVELPREDVLSALALLFIRQSEEHDEERDKRIKPYIRTSESYGFLWLKRRPISDFNARLKAITCLGEWDLEVIRYYRKKVEKTQGLINLLKASSSPNVSIGQQDFADIKPYYKVAP